MLHTFENFFREDTRYQADSLCTLPRVCRDMYLHAGAHRISSSCCCLFIRQPHPPPHMSTYVHVREYIMCMCCTHFRHLVLWSVCTDKTQAHASACMGHLCSYQVRSRQRRQTTTASPEDSPVHVDRVCLTELVRASSRGRRHSLLSVGNFGIDEMFPV